MWRPLLLGEHLNLWYNYQICPLWREYNIFPTIFRPNRIIPFHFHSHSFGPFHFLLSILRLFTFFIPFYNIFTPNPLFSFLSPSNPFKPQQRPSRQNQKKGGREGFVLVVFSLFGCSGNAASRNERKTTEIRRRSRNGGSKSSTKIGGAFKSNPIWEKWWKWRRHNGDGLRWRQPLQSPNFHLFRLIFGLPFTRFFRHPPNSCVFHVRK